MQKIDVISKEDMIGLYLKQFELDMPISDVENYCVIEEYATREGYCYSDEVKGFVERERI